MNNTNSQKFKVLITNESVEEDKAMTFQSHSLINGFLL